MLYLILRLLAILLSKLFFRFHVTGREFIPREGGVLIVSNHASYLDPVILGVSFPRPLYFFARADLFKNRLFGWLIRTLHAFPVHVDKLDKDAIEHAIKELLVGKTVVVFPEGTRSRTGALRPGQAGAGFFAVKAKVPVLPVYLQGAYEALPPGTKMIRPQKISIHFGKPLFFHEPPPYFQDKEGTLKKEGRRQMYYQRIADQMMAAIKEIKDLTES